jgi:ABC-type multidrug transport system ATPase subunit
MYAVETQNLIKKYGKTYALKGLDFTVNPSEIMVLLGPNGSGKTTLLMTLATVLKPTSGLAKVMGFDVVKYPTKVRQILGDFISRCKGLLETQASGDSAISCCNVRDQEERTQRCD